MGSGEKPINSKRYIVPVPVVKSFEGTPKILSGGGGDHKT